MVEMTTAFRDDDVNNDNSNAVFYDEPDNEGVMGTKSTTTTAEKVTTEKVTTTKAVLIRKATISTTMFILVMLVTIAVQ